MRRYKKTKSYLWTQELAYIAGLFASDGCLISNGRHLNITSKDYEIIEYCQEALGGIGKKVQIKKGELGNLAFCWQFSDVSLYDFFNTHGITPRKSKTIKQVKLPNEYWGDFLRGYFDGDGTTYAYTDKRWRSSYMYYTGFTSASLDYIKWLQKQNKILCGTTQGSIKKSNRAYTLAYAKLDSEKICNAMYSTACSEKFSLRRKKDKLLSFIARDKNDRINRANARVVKLANTQP